MMRSTARVSFIAVAAVSLITIAGCSGSPSADIPTDTVIDGFGALTETVGPNGEKATPINEVTLTGEQESAVRAGGYTAAILWHELSAWSQAIQDGIEDRFSELGIAVTATGDAKFDAVTQANQIADTVSTQPDVIVGQAVDPTTAAAAYQPAVDAGIKLVFADQAPDGYTYGDQYQAVLTDDLLDMGRQTGAAMCEAVDNEGTVGVIFYDAQFHVTNFRDAAFLQTLAEECPDVTVTAKQGFSDPNKAEEIATGMLARHPDLSGIYVSWAVPAQGVLAALKNVGDTSTKVVTIDLDNTIATDMVSPEGHTAAMIVDAAYEYGRGMANASALAILGEAAPEYGVSPIVTATRATIADAYRAWNQDVPEAVKSASK